MRTIPSRLAATALLASSLLGGCSLVESIEERDAYRNVVRTAPPAVDAARDRQLEDQFGPPPVVTPQALAGGPRRPIRAGSLVIVTMTASPPPGAAGQGQQATVAVLWAGPVRATAPPEHDGPADRNAPRCAGCGGMIAARIPPDGSAGRYALAVIDPGRLGVPDEWVARWAVADEIDFVAPPAAWRTINGRQLERFDPVRVDDRPRGPRRTTAPQVRWRIDFACEADVREVVWRYVGLRVGTPITLPKGLRWARWYEFRGCRDGQTPPDGFAMNAETSALREWRTAP